MTAHRLPGRIRVSVSGLQGNPLAQRRIESRLQKLTGIVSVRCNANTGRSLIIYDQAIISEEQILAAIEVQTQSRESAQTHSMNTNAASQSTQARRFVAATAESEVADRALVPVHDGAEGRNSYLIPSVLSVGMVTSMLLKRFVVGRSVLAVSSATFFASSALSVIVGYPALRRRAESLFRHGRLSPDLWLGMASLAMAAVRENLVALSVITAVNLAMYRRFQTVQTPENTNLQREADLYATRMQGLAKWMAPLSLVITRSPLRAVGVLLAMNPRPVMQAHKYRVARAEADAEQLGLLTPSMPNLSHLVSAKSIVFADESVVHGKGQDEWKVISVDPAVETEKIISLSASLVENTEHPWADALQGKARRLYGTHHQAFRKRWSKDGVSGEIRGHSFLFGTRQFVRRHGVDDTKVAMEERRLRRQGYVPLVLAIAKQPVGVIAQAVTLDFRWQQTIDEWASAGYRVRSLQKSPSGKLLFDSISRETLQGELDAGQKTIVIGNAGTLAKHPNAVQISGENAPNLPQLMRFANERVGTMHRDILITRVWNFAALGLALAIPTAAPFVALSGDALAMSLIAVEHWVTQARQRDKQIRDRLSKNSVTEIASGTVPTGVHSLHHLDLQTVLRQLKSSVHGLSEEEVRLRSATWGDNDLPAPPKPRTLGMFLRQFKEFSTVILLGTTALSFAMGETLSASAMLGILVINASISAWQEKRSTEVIQALKVEDHAKITVVRGGTETVTATKNLVPGDIVVLESGDKVPADLRIVDSWNLEVSEAVLTGESLPVQKHEGVLDEDTPLAERSNSLFMGTMVTRGRCKGVVTATSLRTEIGQLQVLLNDHDESPTFLQQRVSQISKRFVVGAFVAASVVGVAGLLRGIPPIQMLISSVTLAASAIPEGLPITITVALTAGVMKMSKRKTIVKKLANLESLGRVTVICTDKTGTLTKNEMSVKELVTVDRRVQVANSEFQLTQSPNSVLQEKYAVADDADVRQLLTVGLLCNNESLESVTSGTTGDPTEAALVVAARSAKLSGETWKRHREIPFESETRSMSVVCEENETSRVVCEDEDNRLRRCTIFTKGAYESVVGKCTHFLQSGKIHPLTHDVIEVMYREHLRLADEALRVLAFAYRDIPDDENLDETEDENLIFVGLMGMMDPPKDGVREGVAQAVSLGIKPVMITGDHPVTARAIGAEVGIYHPGDGVLTGKDLDLMSPEALRRAVTDTTVFARVSPEHKLRIVQAFRDAGEVVAMTGDGVNDAPAMHSADVGVAMGVQGSEITKGTAGIVLLEDHFHSIVEGIRGGRAIISNIRKAMGCLLAGNLAEVLVTAVSVVIGLPMPLIPLQILMMNVLTDAVPAMVLATGPHRDVPDTPFADVMDKPLYRTVLIRGTVLGLGAVGVFAAAIGAGVALPVARTMTYAALVSGQLLQIVDWRRYGSKHKVNMLQDRVLLGASVGSWAALAATIYIPGLSSLFTTVPLGVRHWGLVIAVTTGLALLSQTWIARNSGTEGHSSVNKLNPPTKWGVTA